MEYANKKLMAFVVYENLSKEWEFPEAKQFGESAVKSGVKHVSVISLWSGDLRALENNEINPEPKIKNTVFVRQARKGSAKFVNLVADAKGLAALNASIDRLTQHE